MICRACSGRNWLRGKWTQTVFGRVLPTGLIRFELSNIYIFEQLQNSGGGGFSICSSRDQENAIRRTPSTGDSTPPSSRTSTWVWCYDIMMLRTDSKRWLCNIMTNFAGHRGQLAGWQAQPAANQLPKREQQRSLLPPVRRHQDRLRPAGQHHQDVGQTGIKHVQALQKHERDL